jgi:hypothetical protein
MKSSGSRASVALASGLLGVLLAAEVSASAAGGKFPAAGTDIVEHDLRVQMDVGDDGSLDETLVFKGRMRLDRGDPYTNEQGLRQVDFVVRDWVAMAPSTILGGQVVYIISPQVAQPTSRIVAEQPSSDFPASFFFKVIFDVQFGGQTVFSQHAGMPEGHGFLVVPPDGNRANSPTITTFETTRILVQHPTLGSIRFSPLDCNDQNSVTLAPSDSIPTLSRWGMYSLIIVLMCSALFVLRGRRGRRGLTPRGA